MGNRLKEQVRALKRKRTLAVKVLEPRISPACGLRESSKPYTTNVSWAPTQQSSEHSWLLGKCTRLTQLQVCLKHSPSLAFTMWCIFCSWQTFKTQTFDKMNFQINQNFKKSFKIHNTLQISNVKDYKLFFLSLEAFKIRPFCAFCKWPVNKST